MATSAVYGDRVKIPDAQSLQLSTPPGFGQYWSYGKDGSGNTIFKYINPDSPKMTQAYNAQNQIVDVPDIGWDGQPWTNRKWLNQINGFSISPDGRSMVSTVPPGQTNVSGVDSSQRYTLNGSGLNTNVNFSYSNQWGSGGSSATLLNISDVAPEKQGEYLSGLTKYATGEYLPVKQYVTKTGDAFGDFLASIDPSTAISRELTNLYQPVEKAITAGVEDVSKALSTDDAKKAMGIAAAYFLPGVGSALGQSLVAQGLITGAAIPYATAIGTALASTGASVAQGVPFDTALTNATVNAVTSTGANSVAGYISKLGASPEVANAITSVGASGLATAAKGGSAADIEKNMTGALAGSTVTGLTGDKLSGAVVGGAVTGGTAGAVAPVAGSVISNVLSDSDAAKTATTAEPTTTTEAATTAPVTTDQAVIDLTGIGAGNAAVTTEQVTIPGATDTFTGAVDLGQTGPTTQTDTFTGAVDLGQTGPAATDTFTGAVDLGETGAVTQPETFTGGVDLGDTGPEEQTDTFTGGVDLGDTGDIIDTGGVDLGDTGEDLSDTETDITTEDATYKPDLFVYGGKTSKTPTTPGRQTTNLGTTLQAPFYPTSTLGQALTGYRGAGEIEGKKTGKPRKDVWNEESLRLKDALGL